MQITLTKFERLDSALSELLRMGPFETCADPRAYICTQNKLLDYCYDAVGRDVTGSYASAEDCAAWIVADALLGRINIVDEEAAQ